MEHNTKITRKNFLSRVLTSWFVLYCLPVFYVVIEYVFPPKLREQILEKATAGKVSELLPNSIKVVKFNKRPVFVLNQESGKIKAFSGICTHLGCVVEYKPEQKHFVCNCHGSVFDQDGKNISGPAPKPLEQLKVDIQKEEVIISKL